MSEAEIMKLEDKSMLDLEAYAKDNKLGLWRLPENE